MTEKRLSDLMQDRDVPGDFDYDSVELIADNKKINPFSNIAHKFTESMIFVGDTVTLISSVLVKKLLHETVRTLSRLHGRMLPHAKSLFMMFKLAVVRFCEPTLKIVRASRVIHQRAELAGAACVKAYCCNKKLCNKSDCAGCARKAALLEGFRAARELAWDSRKVFAHSLNYLAPALSIVFFIGIVKYGSNLEYAVNIRYNGLDLGYIAAESDYDVAEQAVQQKISYVAGNETVTFTPKLSLRIVEDSTVYIDPSDLADKLITNSESDLIEACGVYVDGEFCGAVTDKSEIEIALAKLLGKYRSVQGAENVRFVKDVTFEDSIFLADSLVPPENIVRLLNSNTVSAQNYVITEDDSIDTLIADNGLSIEELIALNPGIDENWTTGTEIILKAPEAFMPVTYTVHNTFTSPISYNIVTLEDSTKYEGYKEVSVKGQNGELTNVSEKIFTNGALDSSEIISSVITKEAITENVVIGTKKASSYSGLVPSYDGPLELDGDTNFIWPVGSARYCMITSHFGHRGGALHGATDIACPTGTDIYAAQDGVVVLAASHYSYGNYVVIDHGNGIVTLYAHASAFHCKEGDYVTAGTLIASVGNTGNSRGSHLHFEVRIDGVRVDPEMYISNPN